MTLRRVAFLAAMGLLCLLAIGCDDREASKAWTERAAAEAREQAERQRREEAERLRKLAEETARLEQERRLLAEKQAKDVAATKWAWIAAVSVLCLVVGVAISSKVKKDFAEQRSAQRTAGDGARGGAG